MAQPRPCVKCHKVSKIIAFNMCRKCYGQRPETKKRRRLESQRYNQLSEVREKNRLRRKLYWQRPENQEKHRASSKRYSQQPENKAKLRLYKQLYRQRQDAREKRNLWEKRYRQKPEVKVRKRLRDQQYRQKPETKERIRLYQQGYYEQPENQERMKVWRQGYYQRPEYKERAKVRRRLQAVNPKIGACLDCKLKKKILTAGLCGNCYRFRIYVGRENYLKMKQKYKQEYRKTPEYKRWAKAYNQLESTKERANAYQKGYMLRKKMDPEFVRIYNYRQRTGHFFRKGRPVGPFDPNEIIDENLLKALIEVGKDNLSLPRKKRRILDYFD